LKPERWGSLLVQEKYQEEKACDKRHPYRIIIIITTTTTIIIIIIIIITITTTTTTTTTNVIGITDIHTLHNNQVNKKLLSKELSILQHGLSITQQTLGAMNNIFFHIMMWG
jgi:hypothetical protein